tara:strand:+ start:199 stop:549 length:351 start_codon:yes stop_codon:yes gene_type:complete
MNREKLHEAVMSHWIIEKRQEAHHVKHDQNHLDMVADVADALLCGASVVHRTDAEARLIASAPDLLAVVERLQAWADTKTSDWFEDLQANNAHQAPNLWDIIHAANVAVSEAKGGE